MNRLSLTAILILSSVSAIYAADEERVFMKKDGTVSVVHSVRNSNGTYKSHQVTHYASRHDFEASRPTTLADAAIKVLMAILSGYIESGRALDDFQDISAAIRNKTAAISAQSGKKFSRVTDAMQFKRSKKPAELAGRIEVNRTERQEWEGFELVEIAKGKVALKYQTGYLCAEYGGGGAVNADRPEIGDWERWNLVDNKDGTFSLQAANGSFLCAEEGGDQALVADREKIGKWESFVLERVGTKSYLKASSGKYVSAQP